jgi:hypothetical protein
MQQFVVPQFIDVEDKIIGPLTVRQFIIMLVGGFMLFLEFKFADFGLFILEALVSAFLVVLFAFMKVNGMPFHFFLSNFISTLFRPKVRVWQKQTDLSDVAPVRGHASVTMPTVFTAKPSLPPSRLQELSLMVDTGGAYKPEDEPGTTRRDK